MQAGNREEGLKRAGNLLKGAKKVAVFTGSGVSKESGIPTFRGEDGLWRNYDARQIAAPEAFRKDPALVWEWYNWRRGLMKGARPNPGHFAIARMEEIKEDFFLITQNVDGLHLLAGNRKVAELHGNIWRVKCTRCSFREVDEREGIPYPPLCPECRSLLRPDVVWFGEPLDQGVLREAITFSGGCDLLISAGTSTLVFPAAQIPFTALRGGASLIEVNVEPTPLTPEATLFLRGKAGEILPEILRYSLD